MSVATITIPAGTVASTLTNFVTRVDLADFDATWWAGVEGSGANIRVRQGASVIPFDVVRCDAATRTGELFFKATLTTGDNVFTVAADPGVTGLAASDPNGRNAVWSDYDVVVDGSATTVNRTGGVNPTLTGSLPLIGPASLGPVVTAHQGVARDVDGNWYVIDTDAIRKYDANWNLLTTRTGANAATGIAGVDHLGDGTIHNGELWVPVEKYPAAGGVWNNQHLTVWNLADLTFNRSYNISAQAHEVSSVCYNAADGLLYVTAYEGTNSSTLLYKYDPADGSYKGTLTTPAITFKQGIEVWDGHFWITSDDTSMGIYQVSLNGASSTRAYAPGRWAGSNTGENLEGLCAAGGQLAVLLDFGAVGGVEQLSRVIFMEPQGTNGRIHMDGNGNMRLQSLARRTAYTLGATVTLASDLTANHAALSYGTNTTNNTTRATLGYSSTNAKVGLWNTTDGWLLDPTAPTQWVSARRHATHNGTTDRKLWRDGSVVATDAGVAQFPVSPGDNLFIGAEDVSYLEWFFGSLERIYLRNGVLSPEWLAAEQASWETASFYVATSDWVPEFTAGFSGAGSLTAVIAPVVAVAAAFSGTGSLAAEAFEAGAIPPVVAGFSGDGVLSALVEVATPVAAPSTTIVTREGGRTRSGLAGASWEPSVVQPPASEMGGAVLEHRRIRGSAFGHPTSLSPVTYAESEATAPRHRTRIMVGGKDVSFFRGVPTPEPEYQLAEPLRWGPSSIELPQIAAAFFNPADHPWLAKGKPVTYQRVDAEGNKLAIDYRGVVVAYDTSGKTLRVEVGGHAQGRAALRHKPLPIFKDTLDLGRLAWAAIRDLGLAFSPRMGPTTGIKQALFGGSDHLTHISELCAKAFDFDGQWSLMPDDAGRYTFARKDRSTVHWTLFNDDTRTVADLRSDAAEEHNRIFATGVTPKGQRVRFGVYPQLKPGPAAPYPFTDERNFGQWTTDAETDTGDGITVMVRKLWTAGFLSLEEIPGDYDSDVTRAIMALQDQAGRPITGNMNPATWAALFDLEDTGYSLRGSRIEPAAQDYRVRRYNRSSSGAIIGKNPNFDPNRLIVDREIDFGSGFKRHQMRDMARAEVYRGEDNWFGTITITKGAILRGNIAPGTTLTEADLADVRDIQPGQNVTLPLFAGGILLHISGVEVTRGQDGHPIARLTVDTQARDAMAVWEMIRRNRETRRDPARRWKGNRASGQVKDSITEWDEVGGVLYGDRELEPGWNVVEVVGGQEGSVSRLRLNVHDADGAGVEFACSISGKKFTAARMNTLVPAPLSANGHKAWEDADVRAVLKKKLHLYSAGTNEEPCGYSPGRKADDDPLRGIHEDDAGFSYRTDRQPVLYLAVYVRSTAVLEGGRVMWNQLEAGA